MSQSSLKDKLRKLHFRSCLNCGSFILKIKPLCCACDSLMLATYSHQKIQSASRIEVYPLLTWSPGASDTLSKLVLEMKTIDRKVWFEYAKNFIVVWSDIITTENVVLISHKSLSGNRHAHNWGESLSQLLNRPHIECLSLQEPNKKQKELSSEERAHRRMETNVDFSWEAGRRYIFVDDVVTTGSTALAAYRALGRPKNFQVWSFAYRSVSSIAAR